MSYQDVPAFHAEARDIADKALAPLRYSLLTVARTHEILNMRWSQLDLDRGQWILPAPAPRQQRRLRRKGGNRHQKYLRQAHPVAATGARYPSRNV